MTTYRRKLIEVDLPLDDINRESAREKSIRHGHPSTLHMWWSRKPLAACRAVIFASMVDDPSSCPDEFPTEDEQRARARAPSRHHPEAGQMGKHRREQTCCEGTLGRSTLRNRPLGGTFQGETAPTDPAEVLNYLRDQTLPIYDPFAGGGSIPLEAQRLGLKAIASDLNPVAVLLNKALIEIPPKFRNHPPVNPESRPHRNDGRYGKKKQRLPWRGASGLADDIRYYGAWMREEAFKRIGHLYPKAKLPDGSNATVIAWLWARTIPCPNPACGVQMPLKTTFQASKKRGNEHWMRPVVDHAAKRVSFVVQNHSGGVPEGGTVGRNGAVCIACNNAVPLSYVREQRGLANGEQMTAIVAEGDRSGSLCHLTDEHIQAAVSAEPTWWPTGHLARPSVES